MNKKKQILPAVAAIIFNDKGEVLLQKRQDVSKWNIISGHVEFGETVTNAILREIKEETTVSAVVKRFIGVYSTPGSQTYHYNDGDVHYVTLYFEAALMSELPLNFTNNETKALAFFAIDNLPKDFDIINSHWLEDALANEKTPFIR